MKRCLALQLQRATERCEAEALCAATRGGVLRLQDALEQVCGGASGAARRGCGLTSLHVLQELDPSPFADAGAAPSGHDCAETLRCVRMVDEQVRATCAAAGVDVITVDPSNAGDPAVAARVAKAFHAGGSGGVSGRGVGLRSTCAGGVLVVRDPFYHTNRAAPYIASYRFSADVDVEATATATATAGVPAEVGREKATVMVSLDGAHVEVVQEEQADAEADAEAEAEAEAEEGWRGSGDAGDNEGFVRTALIRVDFGSCSGGSGVDPSQISGVTIKLASPSDHVAVWVRGWAGAAAEGSTGGSWVGLLEGGGEDGRGPVVVSASTLRLAFRRRGCTRFVLRVACAPRGYDGRFRERAAALLAGIGRHEAADPAVPKVVLYLTGSSSLPLAALCGPLGRRARLLRFYRKDMYLKTYALRLLSAPTLPLYAGSLVPAFMDPALGPASVEHARRCVRRGVHGFVERLAAVGATAGEAAANVALVDRLMALEVPMLEVLNTHEKAEARIGVEIRFDKKSSETLGKARDRAVAGGSEEAPASAALVAEVKGTFCVLVEVRMLMRLLVNLVEATRELEVCEGTIGGGVSGCPFERELERKIAVIKWGHATRKDGKIPKLMQQLPVGWGNAAPVWKTTQFPRFLGTGTLAKVSTARGEASGTASKSALHAHLWSEAGRMFPTAAKAEKDERILAEKDMKPRFGQLPVPVMVTLQSRLLTLQQVHVDLGKPMLALSGMVPPTSARGGHVLRRASYYFGALLFPAAPLKSLPLAAMPVPVPPAATNGTRKPACGNKNLSGYAKSDLDTVLRHAALEVAQTSCGLPVLLSYAQFDRIYTAAARVFEACREDAAPFAAPPLKLVVQHAVRPARKVRAAAASSMVDCQQRGGGGGGAAVAAAAAEASYSLPHRFYAFDKAHLSCAADRSLVLVTPVATPSAMDGGGYSGGFVGEDAEDFGGLLTGRKRDKKRS